MSLLLAHAGREAAALDHEALDDAVEDGAVVETFGDVAFEVLRGDRSFFAVELKFNRALVGRKTNHAVSPLAGNW